MMRSDAARMDAMEEKLDELIRLSHARDGQINEISDKVDRMAPTVQQMADAVTFAKVGRSVFRVLVGIGIVTAPVLYWMADRWHILGQLFKRAP